MKEPQPSAQPPSTQNDRLWAILDTAPDAAIAVRADGIVAGWNGPAEKAFGWRREEALGRRLSDLIEPDPERAATRTWTEAVARRRSGEEFPAEVAVTPLGFGEDGLLVVFLRDISARRQNERRLEREAREADRRAEVEQAERKRIETHQSLLLSELNHRVKNMLSVVTAIAGQTARNSPSIEAFNRAFLGRLDALARAQSLVTARSWQAGPLRDVVKEAVSAYAHAGNVDYGGPDVPLEPSAVMTVGMILYELVSNAARHGALSVPEGRVAIKWEIAPQAAGKLVRLRWRESGLSGLARPSHRGFGTAMIETSVNLGLEGSVETHYHAEGVEYDIRFPWRAAAS